MTLVCQDWGGLIGLRVVTETPELAARIVVANTGLPTGDQAMPEVWWMFRRAVESAEVLDIGRFVASGCAGDSTTAIAPPTTRRLPTRPRRRGRGRCPA